MHKSVYTNRAVRAKKVYVLLYFYIPLRPFSLSPLEMDTLSIIVYMHFLKTLRGLEKEPSVFCR